MTSRITRVLTEIAIAAIGIAFIAGAIAANQEWLDRHFMPTFLLPHDTYVRIETGVRIGMVVFGVFLALVVRPRAGRFVAHVPARALSVTLAALLALGASEPILHRMHLQPAEWLLPDEEPLRRADARLGWTFVPSRVGQAEVGGRSVEYAFDAHGYRVKRVDAPVDPDRPAIVFTGESVMFGEGLTWEESIPAQVSAMMGIQSANLAVHGYGSDQAFMHLQAELPRFRQPIAIVTIFMGALFGRNLDHERPHLTPGLTWEPREERLRLLSLGKLLVPYRSDNTIDQGIAMTRDVLKATIDLARSRGAMPLIVIPQLERETTMERTLRQRIFDDAGLPYIHVEIDPTWRIPWDRHPDARAAHALAEAIVARLKPAIAHN
jgi:hypothetical protein